MARPSLHLSKCHIVGNHVSRLIIIMICNTDPRLYDQPIQCSLVYAQGGRGCSDIFIKTSQKF